MPTVSLTKTYGPDGTTLTTQELDDLKSSIETALNTTKLDSTNIQTGGIATANIASQAIDATKIASSAVGSGLTGGAGTALAVNVDTSTIEINANTLRVKDLGIVTAKLADASITAGKLAAVNYAISSACTSQTITGNIITDVTNLSVSITTTGRPVILKLISASTDITTTADGYISAEQTSGIADAPIGYIVFDRGGSPVSRSILGIQASNSGNTGTVARVKLPPSAFEFFETPAAGTYTYKVRAYASGGSVSVVFLNVKLVARELY